MEIKLEMRLEKDGDEIEKLEWSMEDTQPSVIQAAAREALRKCTPLMDEAIVKATPNG